MYLRLCIKIILLKEYTFKFYWYKKMFINCANILIVTVNSSCLSQDEMIKNFETIAFRWIVRIEKSL